jgi:hypothetical protein
MAASKDIFPSGFRGRIGNVVVYQALGKTIVRSMPSKKRAPAKGAQKQTQNDFARVMKILQTMTPFVRIGFHDAAEGRTAFQTAMSENLRRFMEAAVPENLQWLLVSKGERAGAVELRVQRNEKMATAKWDAAPESKLSSDDDMVMVLALNTATLACNYNPDAGSRRNGQAKLPLPPALPGEKILFFIAFRNISGTSKKSLKNISESQYIEIS